MPAYQIQVRGLLDGVTPFVIPAPLPAPSLGGVIKIDAGAGNDVGTFDLNALALASGVPVWVRAFQTELAALTVAARANLNINGSRQVSALVPVTTGDDNVIWRLYNGLNTQSTAPIGSILEVLTDDASIAFAGAPTAGPHFVYLDLEPIVSDEVMTLIQTLQASADLRSRAEGAVYTSFQATAATLDETLGIWRSPLSADIAPSGTGTEMGQFMILEVTNGDVAAAGEDMLFEVRADIGGGSRVLAAVTIDDTIPANSVTPIPITVRDNDLFDFENVRVVRTYTAGMAPTPMTNTLVRLSVVPTRRT